MSAAEMVNDLRAEIANHFDCGYCLDTHHETASLPAIIAGLEDVARAIDNAEALTGLYGVSVTINPTDWATVCAALARLREVGWEG